MIFRLIYMNGPHKGERITVTREPMTIGRDPSCSISLSDDPEVALKHCIIVHAETEELRIQDSGSMNRVLVNSHEVSVAKLKHGDILEIGRTRLLVQAFVQADVNNGGSLPKRKKRSILRPAITLLILAGIAFAGYRAVSSSISRDKAKPPAAEVIPPSIFKDIQATEPVQLDSKQETPSNSPNQEATSPPTPAPPAPAPAPAVKPDTAPVSNPKPVDAAPKPAPVPKPAPAPKPPANIPPPIIIAELSQQKFPQNPEYDEMRVATLKLKTTGSVVDDSKVAVKIEFFDRDLTSGEITPARAIVPLKALTTTTLASLGEETLSAAYTVPKGLRTARSADSGHTFYGVVASVMYAGDVVARKAVPASLLKED